MVSSFSKHNYFFSYFPFYFLSLSASIVTPKSKELTSDVKKVIVDLSTQGLSGKKISEQSTTGH